MNENDWKDILVVIFVAQTEEYIKENSVCIDQAHYFETIIEKIKNEFQKHGFERPTKFCGDHKPNL